MKQKIININLANIKLQLFHKNTKEFNLPLVGGKVINQLPVNLKNHGHCLPVLQC